MAKRFYWTKVDLPFSGEEEMIIWEELKTKKLQELKTGETLFVFLKLGFSALQIDGMLDLRPTTIEKRCVEYLLDKKDNYDDFKFLFEECKGLPRIKDINIYLRSSHTSVKKFCAIEGIYYEDFNNYMNLMFQTSYVQERIKEREERLQEKSNNPKCKLGRRKKANHLTGFIIKLS